MALTVNPIFQKLLTPLTAEQKADLRASIEAIGCYSPIAVWRGQIIDGHHRYDICTATGQSYKLLDLTDDLTDELAVTEWILQTQSARRNLSFDDLRDCAGRLYELARQKKAVVDSKGDKSNNSHGEDSSPLHVEAEKIGAQFGVSGRSVRTYASEAEKKKDAERIAAEIRVLGEKEGWDEVRMQEAFEEMMPGESGDDVEFDPGPSSDDYASQYATEPTEEQKASAPPKTKKAPKFSIVGDQKKALRTLEACLNKIQGLSLDRTFNDATGLEPDYKTIFSAIERERAKFPQPKKKFGR